MSDETITGKDPQLWALAKKRAGFKSHLYSYIIVNGFLWLLWFLTTDAAQRSTHTPWPIWPLIGWGIGLTFHFVSVYIFKFDEESVVQKEYEKLLSQKHE